jgi:23S rRNA pseudouridine955/2504/2580 synthase
LLVAKKRSALTTLQDVFRNRQVQKTYAALVIGAWPASRKVIDVALHKFLTPEGERRVMAVARTKTMGGAPSAWCTWCSALRSSACWM